ncbi:MAG: class E sortase, partial [Corynebacterium striatum]|nr:class E sortase [Corynebacterium striatum]
MNKNRVSTVIGELLLTVGVILLLFAFYEAYWTNLESGRLQEKA